MGKWGNQVMVDYLVPGGHQVKLTEVLRGIRDRNLREGMGPEVTSKGQEHQRQQKKKQ
jgi:hypothetical protein